jgi:MFS family permease
MSTRSPFGGRVRWLPPLAAFAVFAFETRRYCRSGLYFVDDPFISMRYAANLFTRGELSFNAGDRVEGYSNFLHVLVHALDMRIRGHVPDPASAIDGAAAIVLWATLLSAVLLGSLAQERHDREEEAAAWYYAWVLTMASWPFAFWGSAGMETPIEGLLYIAVLWCTTRLSRRSDRRVLPILGLLLAAIVLLRFEGVVVALAIAGALAFYLTRREQTRTAMALGAGVTALAAAYHLWRLSYFGAILPNTFVAKATGGSLFARLQAGASYCGGWISLLGGGVGLSVAAVAVARRRPDREALVRWAQDPVVLVAAVIVVVKVALVVWGGGDWMPGWRMLVPISPIALFLAMRVLFGLLGRGVYPQGGVAAAFALALVVCGRGTGVAFTPHTSLPNDVGHFKKLPRDYVLVGDLIEKSFAGGHDEVAIGEAGLVPFDAIDVRFMDLFGLVDRDMARQPGFMHNRVHVAHVLERAPSAVLFAHLEVLPPYGPYQYGPELLAAGAFHAAYRRVDIGSELEAFGWALYVRRDVDPGAHGLAWADHDSLRL